MQLMRCEEKCAKQSMFEFIKKKTNTRNEQLISKVHKIVACVQNLLYRIRIANIGGTF